MTSNRTSRTTASSDGGNGGGITFCIGQPRRRHQTKKRNNINSSSSSFLDNNDNNDNDSKKKTNKKKIQKQFQKLRSNTTKDYIISEVRFYYDLDFDSSLQRIFQQECYKLFQRDQYQFSKLKFIVSSSSSSVIDNKEEPSSSSSSSSSLGQIITMILDYNITKTLVLSYPTTIPTIPTTDGTDGPGTNDTVEVAAAAVEVVETNCQTLDRRRGVVSDSSAANPTITTTTGSIHLSSSQEVVAILQALHKGLRTNKSIQVLKLLGTGWNCAGMKDTTVIDYSWLFCTSTLKELHFSSNRLLSSVSSLQSFCHGLSSNTSLEILQLDNCQLNDKSLASIISSLTKTNHHSKLSTFDISYNSAHTQTLSALTQLFKSTRLTTLKIAFQQQQQSSTPTQATRTRTTAPLLSSNDQENDDHDEDERAFHFSFLQAIKALAISNTSLQHLDLSGNDLSSSPSVSNSSVCPITIITSLMECCCRHPTLQYLNLSHCQLKEYDMIMIASYLPQLSSSSFYSQLSTIKVLTVGNQITSTIIKQFLRGIQTNSIITCLGNSDDYNDNVGIGDRRGIGLGLDDEDNLQLLQYYLDLNRAGRRVFQSSSSRTGRRKARGGRGEYDDDNHQQPLPSSMISSHALWSNILARVTSSSFSIFIGDSDDDNDDDNDAKKKILIERQASVLFSLLQGPVLLER